MKKCIYVVSICPDGGYIWELYMKKAFTSKGNALIWKAKYERLYAIAKQNYQAYCESNMELENDEPLWSEFVQSDLSMVYITEVEIG
jgi:hypothetical protein